MYDIVYISYKEPNAELNWKGVFNRFPDRTKRLHGIKGIHQAHIIAANMVTTDMFYVVDGDAIIQPDFHFNHQVPWHQKDHIHVFRALNPINKLIYGYGAVKLLPTQSVLDLVNHDLKPDMTSSLPNARYHVIHELSNITGFNTSEFDTWRSAFRECTKLSSRVIDGQVDKETEHRLNVWCTVGHDEKFGDDCIRGAQAGRAFGKRFKDDIKMLFNINDMDWLMQRYNDWEEWQSSW